MLKRSSVQVILKYHPLQMVCLVFYATQQVHFWNYVNIELEILNIFIKLFDVLFSIDSVVSIKSSKQIGRETAWALVSRVELLSLANI